MKTSFSFIKLEVVGAKVLFGVTVLALIFSNSAWQEYYTRLFNTAITFSWWQLTAKLDLLHIINEGLMTIFFLVVGLEIKYELLEGALNSPAKAALPAIAAIGGMIVPAIIYIAINYYHLINARGWAIPTATDIAFALGIISLLGHRVPGNLKSLLMALAILDDLAAILIIALFYTEHISFMFLAYALACWILLFIINKFLIANLLPYLIIGIILWVCLLKSGVNPTLAGGMLAATIPMRTAKNYKYSPLHKLKNWLHPYVALGILPLFAFANAGVPFMHLSIASLQINILLGVMLGLLIGKQLGVFSFCWLAVKLGWAKLPEKIRWLDMYALAITCGIGFTISIFIGSLAFDDYDMSYISSVKLGVIGGSLLSGIFGYLLLMITHHSRQK